MCCLLCLSKLGFPTRSTVVFLVVSGPISSKVKQIICFTRSQDAYTYIETTTVNDGIHYLLPQNSLCMRNYKYSFIVSKANSPRPKIGRSPTSLRFPCGSIWVTVRNSCKRVIKQSDMCDVLRLAESVNSFHFGQ